MNYYKIKEVLGTILTSCKFHLDTESYGMSLKEFNSFFDTYAMNFERTINNNGKKYTLTLFKELHNQSTKLVTNEPWSPIPFHKSSKEGISTMLLPILKHLRGDNITDIRIILSITRLHESIRLPAELELSSILNSYEGKRDLDEFADEFREFLKESQWANKLKQNLPRLSNNQQLIGRIRSGPNGQAIISSHYDAVAIFDNEKLATSILQFNGMLSQNHITQNML